MIRGCGLPVETFLWKRQGSHSSPALDLMQSQASSSESGGRSVVQAAGQLTGWEGSRSANLASS